MGDVVDLQQHKEDGEPHIEGPCRCMHCGHEWRGVTPVSIVAGLHCSECSLNKGILTDFISPEDKELRYSCGSCQGEIFTILKDGALCALCGIKHSWDDIAEG